MGHLDRSCLTAWIPIALATVLACPEASASDHESGAAQSFREGAAAFARRDYRAAASAWERAAADDPHPAALLNAADAWQRVAEWVRAAEDCDQALALPNLSESFRTEAERQLAILASHVATIELRARGTFTARIDGGAELKLPRVRRVTPGRHTIVFRDESASTISTSEVELAPGDTKLVQPPGAPAAAHDAEAPQPVHTSKAQSPPQDPGVNEGVRGPGPTTGSWVAFGIAGASGAVAIVFGVMTLQAKSQYNDHPTPAGRDAFYRDKTITNVALAAAGASAILGLALVRWRSAPRSAGLAARWTAYRGGGGLSFEVMY
jgi:hypothetical protein